jgi:alanine racemase
MFRLKYKNLNIVEINRSNLEHNLKYFQNNNPNMDIFPVLKSNAYGHGIVEISKILDNFNLKYLAVDSLFEAYKLVKSGIKTPILIIGYTDPYNYKVKNLNFSFEVFDLDTINVLDKYQKNPKIHIKIDCGMHRLGLQLEDIPYFIKNLKKFRNVFVEGIMGHFSDADNTHSSQSSQRQLNVFRTAVNMFENEGFKFLYKHISATSGLLNVKNEFNAARLGLGLYGISPIPKYQKDLCVVLKLKTHIIQIKKIKKGETIGYSDTFKVVKDSIIGIIPIGYYDAVDRRLSNKGFISINNKFCPIVGLVSMNMVAIDITGLNNIKVGEEVLVISNNPKDKNSVVEIAKKIETIPYDVLVHINQDLKRVII